MILMKCKKCKSNISYRLGYCRNCYIENYPEVEFEALEKEIKALTNVIYYFNLECDVCRHTNKRCYDSPCKKCVNNSNYEFNQEYFENMEYDK